MKSIPWGLASLGILSALLLAGCGGGGGGRATVDADPNVEGTDVPHSATTSSAGALAFVKRVAATSDNTSEPIRVGGAVLATSDTDESDSGI
ncbi:hypothetical protein [Caenimonas soli]|uniref:hypothetical protein n=1 Tax=Caenimonas soli TaxID=2735555 RepID=UPI001553601D|nr:hypothetical protein [Caenimonas soli]NPC58427.1 hypothetical protein [Caenimonas soli]